MSRSLKKGPFVHESILKKLSKLKPGDKTVIKTWSRASVITPQMVGFSFAVHNGKTHVQILLVENMVGHRLGEFVPTRKFTVHGGKMAKEQALAAAQAEADAKAKLGEKAPVDAKEAKKE